MTSRFYLTDEEHDKIYRLRERDRLTITELSKRFNVNTETIRHSLEKYGIRFKEINSGIRQRGMETE